MPESSSLAAAPPLPPRPPAAAVPVFAAAPALDRNVLAIRRLVLLYLGLWIFEGALRKWVFPGLATPLLVVRDPVLLLIYWRAIGAKLFPGNAFVFAFLGLGALCVAVTLVATPTPPLVAFYGFRANFLHVPLMFIFPRVLDRAGVLAVGRAFLWLTPPMAVLVLGQFGGSPSGWLNTGAGGGEGGQIESAMGHVRASGTFSFTNGLGGFTAIVTAFVLFQVLVKGSFPRTLWLAASGATVVIVALSGSRHLVGLVALVVGALVVVCFVRPKFLQASLKLALIGFAVVLVLGSFAVFKEGLGVFSERFGDRENVKKGFVDRYFEGILVSPKVWQVAPLEGFGLGRGTNAGSGMLTGQRHMLLAEGEYDRLVMETGPLLGSVNILLRQGLAAAMIWTAYRALRRRGDPLPLLLGAACFNDVFQGQFSQPTALGFAVIGAGLCLSAARAPAEVALPAGQRRRLAGASPSSAPIMGLATAAPVVTPRLPRGRSRYAEQLHRGEITPSPAEPAGTDGDADSRPG